jgi:chaperonin GroES
MIPKPLDNRIIVERDESDDSTTGGLHIPDTARNASDQAVVKAIGPGKVVKGARQPLECSVGDRVLIAKYAGTEITHNGTAYFILRDEDVLAVMG